MTPLKGVLLSQQYTTWESAIEAFSSTIKQAKREDLGDAPPKGYSSASMYKSAECETHSQAGSAELGRQRT